MLALAERLFNHGSFLHSKSITVKHKTAQVAGKKQHNSRCSEYRLSEQDLQEIDIIFYKNTVEIISK